MVLFLILRSVLILLHHQVRIVGQTYSIAIEKRPSPQRRQRPISIARHARHAHRACRRITTVTYVVDWRVGHHAREHNVNKAVAQFFAESEAPDARAKALAKRLQYLYWPLHKTLRVVSKREHLGNPASAAASFWSTSA